MDLFTPAPETDSAYYARRADWERVAAERAVDGRCRRIHEVLADTYAELAAMIEGQDRLGRRERLLIGLAVASGLAACGSNLATRADHVRLAICYRARLDGDVAGLAGPDQVAARYASSAPMTQRRTLSGVMPLPPPAWRDVVEED